ncbi:MAG TPA: type II toxin-antitoxin system RelE/ParE family toxin [Desulfobacterales bacterium]|nr:type II toxin-antitoxin system RelE/ParE family toxin [Desulfobacterales bacterium]
MKTIRFYETSSGKKPVQEFLENLTDKQLEKVTWVLKLIRELDRVPTNYFKKLVNTDNIWEVRASVGGNSFRLLGFFCGQHLIVLTNSFQKKSQKTPSQGIQLAEKRKKEYIERRKTNG